MKRDRITSGVLVISKGQALPARPNKYGNVKTEVAGVRFDSKHESKRYIALRQMERDGLIRDLELQVPFRLEVNGDLICVYKADFVYYDNQTDTMIVEDAKGVRTREYIIKAKLMKAIHNIVISEV